MKLNQTQICDKIVCDDFIYPITVSRILSTLPRERMLVFARTQLLTYDTLHQCLFFRIGVAPLGQWSASYLEPWSSESLLVRYIIYMILSTSDESPKAGPSNNILNPLELAGKIKKCPKKGCTFIAKKKPCLVKHFNSHKVNYSYKSACCTKNISPNFFKFPRIMYVDTP